MKLHAVAAVYLMTCVGFAVEAIADAPDPVTKGRSIAEEADRREIGFGDTIAALSMILRSKDGRERTRRLTWKTLESRDAGKGDRSLTIFLEPKDIRGTAFLSHSYTDRDDDQWLYLPSLKRVKRIAAANKSGSFVGSEFSYEDLLDYAVHEFSYRWLRDEYCGEWRCYVVQRQPLDRNSGYAKTEVWIDQDHFRPVKIEFFDRRDRPLKALNLEDYRQYLGRYWRAHTLRMENHQTGRSSLLKFDEFEFQSGLDAREMEPNALHRVR